MHIDTLVLDGFKSFGRRTEIPFYDDFTTVSGPNGSGKSNIIDAVLFCLGLARSSGIRADKLTDLIYNPGDDEGTPAGPNEASVEVVLDNSDGTLSRDQVVAAAGTDDIGDVDEIRVKRRVKQTEENYYSYYYLNGRSVNLSAIRDLLSQAGIAPEGYNVVMQGDVTGIINMTPMRRREILDEIAGVAEFDAKKEDALAELEVVTDRIDEAELRLEEKRDRLEQLEEERATALEYQGLRDERAEYESYLQAAELEEKREDAEATRKEVEARREEVEALERELDERAGRVARLEEDLESLNREIERKGEDEQLALKRDIEELKGEIARLQGEVTAARERIDDAEAERREAFVELDRKQEAIDDLEAEVRERKLEKASLTAELTSKRGELEEVEAQMDEIGAEFEDLRDELEEYREALEEAKSAKHDLQREQDRLLDEARRRSNESEEVRADLEASRERLPSLEAELEDLEAELAKAEEQVTEVDAAIDSLQSERSELGDDLDAVEDELSAARTEYAELEASADERGDVSFPRAVTTILEADLEGVHGAIAELGRVEEEVAVACETAAGARLANVVVDDDGVGQRCIDYLKAHNAGRATFLPLSEMDVRSLPRLPDRDGVIDFAYNLVEFDDQYAGVFSYVLGSTLIVDDLETARSLMGEYRLVTLDGDVVERSGAMTGGSSRGTRYSFTKGSKGQLARVAERISDLEDERRSIRASISSVEERIETARDRRTEARDQVRDVRSEIEGVEREHAEVETRIERLEERLEEIDAERADVDERMGELEASIADRDEEIAEIESSIGELEEELSGSHLPELSAEADDITAAIDELERQIDSVDASLNELGLERQYTEEAIENLHDRIEAAQDRKASAEERIDELEEQIADEEAALEEKQAAVDELEEELADLKADREELREELREAKEARDEKADELSARRGRLDSLEAAVDRLDEEIASLEDAVDEYDPDEVPDHDTVRENIDRLDRAMARLEPVNMLAIDEYDAVADELDELEARKETLAEERDAILDRIEGYEEGKREAFMDAFEGIDAHFREIFDRLSAGTGELHLEEPDDPFEGGLTMLAKPRDKPIQRLTAMSGGEKSLTALAFIFAIQRYNPAPFYALDEIDAFLDAANAERVGELLDELAENAQFIVVSHRSALLERSERAIGVTMQDDNLSAVTGIALADGSGGSV